MEPEDIHSSFHPNRKYTFYFQYLMELSPNLTIYLDTDTIKLQLQAIFDLTTMD